MDTLSPKAQQLIYATALSTMLKETLEQMDETIAGERFMTDLRDLCERAHDELAALQATERPLSEVEASG